MPNWKKVIVSGSDAELNSLNVTSALTASGLIYPTTDGDNGDFLLTDGAGNLSFSRSTVFANVKNVSGVELQKGTPVHATGTAGNASEVIAASASVASTMPATYILNETLADDAEGLAIITGYINGVDTSAFGEGDIIYVGATGSFTNVKPGGSGNLIQNLGIVNKVDASNGSGYVYGSGRSNDVPNLPVGKVWVGSSTYSVTSSVVHLDETNERLGINTNTPGASLDVIGDISGSTKLTIGSSHTNSCTLSTIAGGTLNTASAACSFIGGGYNNKISDCVSDSQFIGGGKNNSVSGNYGPSVIVGGESNTISGQYQNHGFIGGGQNNEICEGAPYSVIVGGRNNTIDGDCGFIGGGYNNTNSSYYAGVIVGGRSNTLSAYACDSVIVGGGSNTNSGKCSFIGAGYNNTNSGYYNNFIGAGNNNTISGYMSDNAIVSGFSNTISVCYGFIGSGVCNTISGYYGGCSTIVGGCGNTISGDYKDAKFIGGGCKNHTAGNKSVVVGGTLNSGSGDCSGILGGKNNEVTHANSFIVGSDLSSTAVCTTYVNNLDVEGEYRGYVKNSFVGGFYHSSNSSGTYYYIPSNNVAEVTSQQYYNQFVAPYDGRVKKLIMKYTSGTTPTATGVTLKKALNGTVNATVYNPTVTGGGTTSMKVEHTFGNSDHTFSAGDNYAVLFATTGGTGLLYGFSYVLVVEYNIT